MGGGASPSALKICSLIAFEFWILFELLILSNKFTSLDYLLLLTPLMPLMPSTPLTPFMPLTPLTPLTPLMPLMPLMPLLPLGIVTELSCGIRASEEVGCIAFSASLVVIEIDFNRTARTKTTDVVVYLLSCW